ncbi:MAG: hypothetical protein K0S98_2206 [Propionibacteriaceae bacterium]|nr:hypothetical protein [Propionibacteriaceae bacterium]
MRAVCMRYPCLAFTLAVSASQPTWDDRPEMVRLFRTEHRVDTDVDISSVAFWRRTFPLRDVAFARLRAERPMSWHPALETPGYPKSKHHEAGFWAVTTAEDIAYASRHHELFSSELGR